MSEQLKSGFVTILGQPNVGKSTLLNACIEEDLSIVTPKANTTRHSIKGILTAKDSQIVFVDTPGIHSSENLLNKSIVENAWRAIEGVDVFLHVLEFPGAWSEEEQKIFDVLSGHKKPYFLVINKIDLGPTVLDPSITQEIQDAVTGILWVSSTRKLGLDLLLESVRNVLPEGPYYFPEDDYTDCDMRFLVSEQIRKQLFLQLHLELPFAMTVVIDKFIEEEKINKIHASIIVATQSHKIIVIGKKGSQIKSIGQKARHVLEEIFDKKVYLELFVKVVPKWTKKEFYLKEYGIKE